MEDCESGSTGCGDCVGLQELQISVKGCWAQRVAGKIENRLIQINIAEEVEECWVQELQRKWKSAVCRRCRGSGRVLCAGDAEEVE
ncbi:Hypothetical predicted protein, partial [Pelobates cultripes]